MLDTVLDSPICVAWDSRIGWVLEFITMSDTCTLHMGFLEQSHPSHMGQDTIIWDGHVGFK